MTSDTRPPPPATPAPLRPGGFRLGRVLGVPVYLRYSWLLLAFVVVVLYARVLDRMLPQLSPAGQYAFAVGFVLCLLLSVLLHEIGHAVVARHYGIRVRAITLELLGGYTEMETDSPHPRADLLVSIVGPSSPACWWCALAAWAVLPPQSVVNQLAFQLAWSNLIVAYSTRCRVAARRRSRASGHRLGHYGQPLTGSTVAGWIGRALSIALPRWVGARSVPELQRRQPVSGDLGGADDVAGCDDRHRPGPLVPGCQGQLAPDDAAGFTVPTGTPLSEAIRQINESGVTDGALAVSDGSGRVVALVHDESAAAVPAERRPWVPVDSVARTVEPGRTLPADLSGEDVIRAVQANPAATYLVVSGGDVVGVLRTVDLARVLNS
jgi:hypothetical protein